MSKKLNKKGFTLIEVVLVLAIGGLIFLLAFIAFQQVSRNRRDTQRRSDAGRLVAELQNYKGDKGSLPTDFSAFLNTYMGADFKDPSGSVYVAWTADPFATPKIKYTPGTGTPGNKLSCSSTDLSTSDFKVELALEKAGTSVCKDSL